MYGGQVWKKIEAAVKTCNVCQAYHRMLKKALIHPWENTTSPWLRIFVDFAGPFFFERCF